MKPRIRLSRALLSAANRIAIRERIEELKSRFLELQGENPDDEKIIEIEKRLGEIEDKLGK